MHRVLLSFRSPGKGSSRVVCADLSGGGDASRAPTMQQPPPLSLRRRRPKIRGGRAPGLRRRRRLQKGRSFFQPLNNSRRSGRRTAARLAGGCRGGEEEMEMLNMRLYLQNRCIMEENQRLKRRALALRLENRLLLTQIRSGGEHLQPLPVHEDDGRGNAGGGADEEIAARDSIITAGVKIQPDGL